MLKEGLIIISPEKCKKVFYKRLDSSNDHFNLCKEYIAQEALHSEVLDSYKDFYSQALYLIKMNYVLLQLTSYNGFDVFYLPEVLEQHQYKWLKSRKIFFKKLNLALVSLEENIVKDYDSYHLNTSVYKKLLELMDEKRISKDKIKVLK